MICEFRKYPREALSGILAGSDRREFDVRMQQQQAHQLLAGVTRSAHNGYLFLHHLTRKNAKSVKSLKSRSVARFWRCNVLTIPCSAAPNKKAPRDCSGG